MKTDIVSDWYVLGICVGYGIAAWLLQMSRTAPPRDWLRERLWSLEARIAAKGKTTAGEAERHDLVEVDKSITGSWLRVPSSRVQAGWRNIHGLVDDHILHLPDHVVDQQLETTRTRLAGLSSSEAARLVERITRVLVQPPDSARRAALLREASIYRHNRNDENYEDVAGFLGKAVWLTVVALAIVVGLTFLFDRESYFLFGAAGALISRLSRVLERRPSASDYGAEWSTLILSPATGALAGWVGILITSVLARPPFDVLSERFAPLWDDPTRPLGFVVAFVFGFSERLFNRLLGLAKSQVGGKFPQSEKRETAKSA